MPTNTFSLGRDTQIVLIGPYGRLDLSIVTSFDSKPRIHKVGIIPLNGPPVEAHLPNGWDFTITLDRATSAADDVQAAIEAGWWAGGIQVQSTLYQYITERSGAISTYQFDGATFHVADIGSYKADEVVKQTISGFASTRRKIS